MKLNLGCGSKKIQDFINIDFNDEYKPNIVGDITNLDQFCENESVDEIVAFDVIEHFDKLKIKEIISNWYMKLKEGGNLIIRTPDIERIIDLYYKANKKLSFIPFLNRNKIDFPLEKMLWHIFSEHHNMGMGHKWMYSKKTLTELLTQSGFNQLTFTNEQKMIEGNYLYSGINDDCGKSDYTNMHVIAIK